MLGSASRGHAGHVLLAVATFISVVAVQGSQAHGAATPALHANGRIAFVDAFGYLASMSPDGSGEWGIEPNVRNVSPAWSPDGSRLAVVGNGPAGPGILVMQPDGSDRRNVTTNGDDSDPAWSPDGTRIAFTNFKGLYIVSADGTGRRLVASNTGAVSHPTWSPDTGARSCTRSPWSGR